MPDNSGRRYEEEFERELRELGSHVEYPPTPDLARAVRRRLDQEGAERPAHSRINWPPFASLRWAAAAAAFLLIVAVPALSPTLRATVAGWFEAGQTASSGQRAGGREAAQAPSAGKPAKDASLAESASPESAGSRPLGEGLGLGERITLREARTRVGADELLLPGMPKLGEPDEVYTGGPSQRGGVVLVYRARSGLPPLADTGVGLVLTELPGEVESAYLADGAPTGAGIEEASVAGGRGYWVAAGPRHSSQVDRTDDLPGSVLFWERGGLALRLEADISKQEAIRIAESVR
jgi:hypothetical protein